MATNIAKLLSIVSPKDAKGVRAFHGSFKDFDRFDDKFIGTGVGQNYGAGHYFSTDPTIAQSYRRRGLSPKRVQLGNTSFDPRDPTQFLKNEILKEVSQEFIGGKTAKLFNSLPPEGQRKLVLGLIDEKIIKAEKVGQPEQVEALVKFRDELSKPGSVRTEYDYFGGNANDSMHEVELDIGPFGVHEFGRNTLKDNPFAMGPQTRPVMDILENMPSESLQKTLSKYGYDVEGGRVKEALFADEYQALAKKHQKELDAIDGDEYDKDMYLDKIGAWNQAQTSATRRLGDAGIPATAYPDSGGIRGRTINYVIHPGQTDRIRQLSKYAVPGAVAAGAAGQAEAGEVEEPMEEPQQGQYLTQQNPEFAYIQALNDFVDNQTVSQQAVDEAFPPNEMRFQQVREMLGPNPTYSQFLPAVAAAENLKGSTYFSYLFPSAFNVARNELANGVINQDSKTLESVKSLAQRHFNGDLSLPAGRSEADNAELSGRGLDPATTLTPAGRENHMHLRGIELIEANDPQQGFASQGGVTAFAGLSPQEQTEMSRRQAVARYARSNIPGTMNPDMFQTVTPDGQQRFLRYSSPTNIYNNQQGNNLVGRGQQFLQSFSNVFRDQDIAAGSGMDTSEIARLRRIAGGLSQEPTAVLPGNMTPEQGQQASRDYEALEKRDAPTLANDAYLGMQKLIDLPLTADPDSVRPFAGKERRLASESIQDISEIGKNSLFDIGNAAMPVVAAPFGAATSLFKGTPILRGAANAAVKTAYSPKDDTIMDALISPSLTGAASAIAGQGYYKPPDLNAIEPRSGLTTQDEGFDEGVVKGDAEVRNNYIRQLRNLQSFSPKPESKVTVMPDQSVYYQ